MLALKVNSYAYLFEHTKSHVGVALYWKTGRARGATWYNVSPRTWFEWNIAMHGNVIPNLCLNGSQRSAGSIMTDGSRSIVGHLEV